LNVDNLRKLEEFYCQNNQLKKLNAKNLISLRRLECYKNKLNDLSIINCPQLYILDCSNNFLNKLDFLNHLNPQELTKLFLGNNIFFEQNLDCFSKFINLTDLYIGNSEQGQDGSLLQRKENEYNRFFGSLKPLFDMTKLEKLDISSTDLSSGLEYLPESIKVFNCSTNKRPQSQVKKIEQELKKFSNLELRGDNFTQLLSYWKTDSKYKKIITRQEQKIKQLEEELVTEREETQVSAEAMDRFYRQNPPREDVALINILQEINTDYLITSQENKKLKETIRWLEESLMIREKLENQVEVSPKNQ